eukprot:623945-Prymnesium_polylepis.1
MPKHSEAWQRGCPVAAQVAATPLMSSSRTDSEWQPSTIPSKTNIDGCGATGGSPCSEPDSGRGRRCVGLAAPRFRPEMSAQSTASSPSGLGALIT